MSDPQQTEITIHLDAQAVNKLLDPLVSSPVPSNEKDTDGKLLEREFNFWLHQNTLLWSRLQTIGVIQVAIVGGWWPLRITDRLGESFLFVGGGVVILALIFRILWRDIQVREDLQKKIGMKSAVLCCEKARCLGGTTAAKLSATLLLVADLVILGVSIYAACTGKKPFWH